MTCFFFLWSTNPVHGVLSLVALGLGFSAVLLGQGLEFPALIVVLVYVGAVTVLFVFVVMMVNLRATPASYVTAESHVVWFALAGVILVGSGGSHDWYFSNGIHLHRGSNLETLGWYLYGTERIFGVLTVGLVLFVAMVSAICLSLVTGENYRTQEFYSQIRKPNAVFVLQN